MLPIVLPAVCAAIIWLLADAVKFSGFFGGALTFLTASGVIGGIPYLLTIVAVFIYTRFLANANSSYVRIGLLMPLIFVFFMHMSVLIISVIDNLNNQRAHSLSFLQMNSNFLALDLLSLVVASVYTLVGYMLLAYLRKLNKIQSSN